MCCGGVSDSYVGSVGVVSVVEAELLANDRVNVVTLVFAAADIDASLRDEGPMLVPSRIIFPPWVGSEAGETPLVVVSITSETVSVSVPLEVNAGFMSSTT